MYKSVIEIKRDVPEKSLAELHRTADQAFDNRAGQASNSSSDPYELVYAGGEDKYGCLELGMLALEKESSFMISVAAWNWIDEEEPGESCDILKVMAMPIAR